MSVQDGDKDPKYWLNQGEQTGITDVVRKHSESAMDVTIDSFHMGLAEDSEVLVKAYKTAFYIANLKKIRMKNPENRIFRNRDLGTVLREGYFPNCSDRGLIFRGLMIAQGIPASWVDTFEEEYLLGSDIQMNLWGHVFSRVYDGNKSWIFDPTHINHFESEQELFNRARYVVFGEGLDSWDLGIRRYEDLSLARSENLQKLLVKYEQLLNNYYHTKQDQIGVLRQKEDA
ncbi:hypothetical protein ACFL0W_04565 [Nanoarchaeota archaeon]